MMAPVLESLSPIQEAGKEFPLLPQRGPRLAVLATRGVHQECRVPLSLPTHLHLFTSH